MKIHQILFVFAFFFIVVGSGIYLLSTTVMPNPVDDSTSNLLGELIEADTNSFVEDLSFQFKEQKKRQNQWLLWCCIPLGILFFVAGLVIKRKTEGPDLFIDQEEDMFEE